MAKRDSVKFKTKKKYGLHSEGQIAICASSVSEVDEIEVQTFKKDLIREGVYVHPIFEWELDVDERRLNRWVEAFNDMKSNGLDIEIVLNHSMSADDVRGYLKDLMVEDGVDEDGNDVKVLFGILEMRGDGVELAKVVKNVSIAVEREFKDGKGRNYGEIISHVGVVQQPIVAGQDEFVPIAASGAGAVGVPILLKCSKDKEQMKMDKELLSKIAKAMGVDAVTEDEAVEKMLSHITGLSETVKTLSAKIEEEEKKGGEADGNKADEKTSELSSEDAEEKADTVEEKLSLLVEQGKLTPDQKKKVLSKFVGEKGKRKSMFLSAKQGVDGRSVINLLCDVLKDGKVQMSMGTKTGSQNKFSSKDDTESADLANEMLGEVGASTD